MPVAVLFLPCHPRCPVSLSWVAEGPGGERHNHVPDTLTTHPKWVRLPEAPHCRESSWPGAEQGARPTGPHPYRAKWKEVGQDCRREAVIHSHLGLGHLCKCVRSDKALWAVRAPAAGTGDSVPPTHLPVCLEGLGSHPASSSPSPDLSVQGQEAGVH